MFIKYCVFSKVFKIYSALWPLSVSLGVMCVHNGRSNISAAAELSEFRKISTLNELPVGLVLFDDSEPRFAWAGRRRVGSNHAILN